MSKPELITRILNRETTEAKMYEIIAAVSLCSETLSYEETRYLGERYFGIFHIVGGKVGLSGGSAKTLYKLIEDENSRRKANNEPLIEYNKNNIFRSIWH